MFQQLLQGTLLIAFNVAIFGFLLGCIFRQVDFQNAYRTHSLLAQSWLLIQVAVWLIAAHLVQILIWSLFYVWNNVMPNLEQAFYFSAVTYATIGYGDVVPPEQWRLIASIEGLTGILMCAWSGGFFFAVITQLYKALPERPSMS